MTSQAMTPFALHEAPPRALTRWIVAAAAVVLTHAAIVAALVAYSLHAPSPPNIIPAIAVSLAPVEASSPTIQDQDVAVGEQGEQEVAQKLLLADEHLAHLGSGGAELLLDAGSFISNLCCRHDSPLLLLVVVGAGPRLAGQSCSGPSSQDPDIGPLERLKRDRGLRRRRGGRF